MTGARSTTTRALLIALPAAALLGLTLLSLHVAATRRAAALGELAALDRRDREAAARPLAAPSAHRARTTRVCPRGVDTLAAALAVSRPPLGPDGSLDPAGLARLSTRALTAERSAERAAGGPALPQRMGEKKGRPVDAKAACVAVDRD